MGYQHADAEIAVQIVDLGELYSTHAVSVASRLTHSRCWSSCIDSEFSCPATMNRDLPKHLLAPTKTHLISAENKNRQERKFFEATKLL
jgi:hypothetical protein